MGEARKGFRFGLRARLNIMLIVGILLISLGLMRITYTVYKHKVDNIFLEQAESAARDIASGSHLTFQLPSHLRKKVDTDEFREVRARAVAANDAQIIEDWMRAQPPVPYKAKYYEEHESTVKHKEQYSLYADYMELVDELKGVMDAFDINDVYLQYVVDGVTYTLVDLWESLLMVGAPKAPIDAFAQYTGEDVIPPTIYQTGEDWLCTACSPIEEEWEDEVWKPALACVDIDMRDVVEERHWFLVNSALYVAALTLVVMAVSMLLTRRLVTKPLNQLAQGATGFAAGEEGFSGEDVIELPIRSSDEIGDLYHEIRSMQARIVDSAHKLARVTAERERVKTELNTAARIQSATLPRQFPAFPDRPEFDLYASMDPAKEVGGDFYDFFMVDDDHLVLVIADVSDKGVPAALFMMSAKNIINYRARMGGTPAEILTSANAQLCEDNAARMFVTVWLGILELSTGRMTCTNAGHEYPFIRHSDGPFERLDDQHGIIMGIMKRATYQEYEIALKPGSKVFVYTDGLAEANNDREEQFGMDRILRALNENPGAKPLELLENMKRAVDGFVGDARQFDDLTMLCMEYRGPVADDAGTP